MAQFQFSPPRSSRRVKIAVAALLLALVLALAVVFGCYWFAADGRTTGEQPPVMAKPAPSAAPAATPPAAAPAPPLWRAIDEARVPNPPRFSEKWSKRGRVLVRVTGAAEAARSWAVGDRLTIPVPQLGATYRPVIEEIDDGPGHSRAALCRLVGDDGIARRILVTVGPTSLFAYIETPVGTYELTADSRHGWLLPTASMMAGFDFSEPDYILPDDHDHDHGHPQVPARGAGASGKTP